jgi:hypothetical protein
MPVKEPATRPFGSRPHPRFFPLARRLFVRRFITREDKMTFFASSWSTPPLVLLLRPRPLRAEQWWWKRERHTQTYDTENRSRPAVSPHHTAPHRSSGGGASGSLAGSQLSESRPRYLVVASPLQHPNHCRPACLNPNSRVTGPRLGEISGIEWQLFLRPINWLAIPSVVCSTIFIYLLLSSFTVIGTEHKFRSVPLGLIYF